MNETDNGNGKHQVSERSLENLKLGAQTRYQGKVRRNTTLLPETIQWLEGTGNVSKGIDTLVDAARKGQLKFSSDNAHQQITNQQSNNTHDSKSESDTAELRWQEIAAQNQTQLMEQKLEMGRLRQLEKDAAEQLALEVTKTLKAASILKQALSLKANAGGEIKKQIREALLLIDDI